MTISVVEDDHVAQIDLLPAVTGGTTMHIYITPPGGSLEQTDEITVTAELPDQQLGPLDIVTFPAGPNHVTTNEANFPLPGQWTITVTARYGEFDQLVFGHVDLRGSRRDWRANSANASSAMQPALPSAAPA